MFLIEYEDGPGGIEQIIHNFSQRTSLCGWRVGIEYDVWADLEGDADDSELTGRERAALRSLVERYGVWWRWSKKDREKVQVPIEEWRRHFESVQEDRIDDT